MSAWGWIWRVGGGMLLLLVLGPRCASISRSPEPQLAGAIVLKTGPGNVNIVLALTNGIGTHCKPFLIAAVVLLYHSSRAPGVSSIRGLVYLNRAVGRIGREVGKVEVAVPVDAHRRIAKRLGCSHGGRHVAAFPRQTSVIRYGKAG